MAVELIVETGAIVPNANTYADLETVRQYATQRGVTLPADDDQLAAMIITAMDYIESFECTFAGERVSDVQSLSWPRADAYLCGSAVAVPTNKIPNDLLKAQCQSVIALSQGLVLQPNYGPQDFIKREKVGPLETEYADPMQTGMLTKFVGIESLLNRLKATCCNGGFSLRTVRV